MEEIWKDIEGYEGVYQVSNLGRVNSLYTNRILNGDKVGGRYLRVVLCKNNIKSKKLIHRLVAQAFIPNPENKPQVNHIDEDKTNNRADNLEWVTRKENANHGIRNTRMSKSKSIPVIAINIKTGESKDFYGASECAKQLGLYQQNITRVLKGKCKQTGGYTFKYKGETK